MENNYTNFEIHGQGVELEPYGLLSINSYSGILTVQEAVDCEKFDVLKVRKKKFSVIILFWVGCKKISYVCSVCLIIVVFAGEI